MATINLSYERLRSSGPRLSKKGFHGARPSTEEPLLRRLCTVRVGFTTPPSRVRIDVWRVELFYQAVGETNPVYWNDDASRAAGHRPVTEQLIMCFIAEKVMGPPKSY